MKSRVFAAMLAMVLASAFYATVQAEDIDIFDKSQSNKKDAPSVLLLLETPGSVSATVPGLCESSEQIKLMMRRVMNILLDPSNSQGFNPATCPALTTAQQTEYLNTVEAIKLGLMLFNDPSDGGDVKGGYVRYDIRPMSEATNRGTLLEKINNCPTCTTQTAWSPANATPACTTEGQQVNCTTVWSPASATPACTTEGQQVNCTTVWSPASATPACTANGQQVNCTTNWTPANATPACTANGQQVNCTTNWTPANAGCTANGQQVCTYTCTICTDKCDQKNPKTSNITVQTPEMCAGIVGGGTAGNGYPKLGAANCQTCSSTQSNCQTCSSTQNCQTCSSTQSNCQTCSSTQSNCQTCSSTQSNCQTCASTTQTTCASCAGLPGGGNAPYSKAMYEAHQLFEGGRNFAGFFSTQYDSAACGATAETAALVMGDKCANDAKYQSAVTGVECPKKYIIFVGTGTPDSGGDNSSNEAYKLLTTVEGVSPKSKVSDAPGLGYSGTEISLGLNSGEENFINEYARELWKNKSIHTYTIMMRQPDYPDKTGCSNLFKTNSVIAGCKLLQNAAEVGGGRFFLAADAQQFLDALNAIFKEIIADNSVFASTALPVSVNVRGTFLNEVYIGMFRPDAKARSRWFGNMKLYQLAVNTSNSVFLADKDGKPADDPNTGFITSTATSFWSVDSTFWTFRQLLGPPYGSSYNGSDVPDGAEVEKGGAAQQIRLSYPTSLANQTTRKLYTYTTTPAATSAVTLSGTDTNTQFNTSNTAITPASLGINSGDTTADAAARTALINWVRGDNNVPESANLSSGSLVYAVRPSVHGDVLHSDPVVVNYGGDNNIMVYYGANDGVFHAVKGGKTGTTAGDELWGLILPEHFNKLQRLRNDSDEYSTAYGATNPRPYFVDGGVGILFRDEFKSTDAGSVAGQDGVPEKVNLFLSMRRGGRFIYALDVTDQTAPKFLWRRGCRTIDNPTSCSTRYDELGQTWSKIDTAKLNLKKGEDTEPPTEAVDVVIFGGGYDPAANDASAASGTATMGRAIFVVKASTGDVIWQASPGDVPSGTNGKKVAGMIYSIPSEVTVLDTNGNGYADRLYVGDTGGNVWRVDIGDADPANWTVRLLASVGGTVVATSGTKTNWPGNGDKSTGTYYARKFMYLPDVVLNQKDPTGEYDAVLIGSGDREHPSDKNVVNRFYMFKDRGGSQTTINESGLYDATENAIQDGTAEQKAAAKTALDAASGWYVTLGTGEKVVGSAITLAGATFFNTNQPKPDTAESADGCAKAKVDRGSLTIPQCTTDLGVACAYALSFLNAGAVVNRTGSSTLDKADRVDVLVAGGFPPSPTAAIVMLDNPNDNTSDLKPYQAIISGSRVEEPPRVKLDKRNPVYWFQKDANY